MEGGRGEREGMMKGVRDRGREGGGREGRESEGGRQQCATRTYT